MQARNHILRLRRRGEQGFTLIELLVVIAVLAILATVVIFNVTGVKNRGEASACATDVKSVQTAVDSWVSDNPTAPAPGSVAAWMANPGPLVPTYLHTVPNYTAECQARPLSITGNTTTGFLVDGA